MNDVQDYDGETLEEQMEELVSAEDFLEFFEVEFDQKVVHVNRLHILQRFHDYMNKGQDMLPDAEDARRDVYRNLLVRAYQDFVESDAITEKVFKVFRMHEPQQTFVPLDEAFK